MFNIGGDAAKEFLLPSNLKAIRLELLTLLEQLKQGTSIHIEARMDQGRVVADITLNPRKENA